MMRHIVAVTLALFALAAHVEGQTVQADRFRLNTGPCLLLSGSGSPEGVVTAGICAGYLDTASGVWYTKWTGTGNTGWGVGHNTNARVNGNLDATGYMSVPGYVSQLTGWRVTAAGAGDFRYVYTDELHAKTFIADLEQALAGSQIICKSVTALASNFTNPSSGGTTTLAVRDLPSAENVAVFQSGDWVGLRSFSRSAGSLLISETFGTVSAYADQAGGVQNWTFTRGTGSNGGNMSSGVVVATDGIVVDYGTSGNGCHETNAIDGSFASNAPYAQTFTWTTSPIPANRTARTRVGNLNGITAVSNEFGAILGTYGTGGTAQFVRASNQAVEMRNVNLSVYSGATEVFKIDRTAPSIALGSAVPTAYGTGTGFWAGNDGGTYKFRVGTPNSAGLFWDGATLTVRGTGGWARNQLANSECRVSTESWTAFTNSGLPITFSGPSFSPWRLNDENNTCYFVVVGTPAVGTASQARETVLHPVVAGNRYEASGYLGVHRSGNTFVHIEWLNSAGASVSTSDGNACTSASAGGTALSGYCRSGVVATAPVGAVNARVLVTTTYLGGLTDPYVFFVRMFFGEATSTQTALTDWGPAGLTEITGGLIRTGTIVAANIAADTITAAQIAANAITATELAANSVTASKINVSSLSAISANIGSITAGSISGISISGTTITGGSLSGTTMNVAGNFIVDISGQVTATNGIVTDNISFSGGGNGYVCVSAGDIFFSTAGC